jgi:Flp pilus assembly protein TadD
MIRPVSIVLGLWLCAASAFAATAQDGDTLHLLEAGRLDGAIAQLEQELGGNPYDAVALNNLAVARARNAEVFSAMDLLDRAVRLAPEHPVIVSNRDVLRDWIARRITAGRTKLELAPARGQRLPEPPALWAR